MLPKVSGCAGEAALAAVQGGGVRDRAPPVAAEVGIQSQVYADVGASVATDRVACPRGRNHQRCVRGKTSTE